MDKINRFIIIDDDVNNNYLCRYIIQSVARDIEILEFTNAENGLTHFSNDKSSGINSILFLDLNMPIMDGFEFLEHYAKFDHAIHDRVQIYILSSSINPADKLKAESNKHVKGYVIKPLTKGTVQNILTGLL